MIPWILVGLIVGSTATADVLQTIEMKRHGEVSDFRPGKLGRMFAKLLPRPFLILTVLFMALSFFAFMKLLTVADLSFAVPATAASLLGDDRADPVAIDALNRQINIQSDIRRWAGAALVACGVALLAV